MNRARHHRTSNRKSSWLSGVLLGGILLASPEAFAQGGYTCETAESLGLNSPSVAAVNWDTSAATENSQISCGNYPFNQVWYTFDPTVTGTLTLFSDNASFVVYDGCAGTELVCRYSLGGATQLDALPVEGGRSYKILVQLGQIPTYESGIPLYASFSSNAVPANDRCESAQPVGMGTYDFDNLNADTQTSTSCIDSSRDVWYSFIAPSAGVYRFESTAWNLAAIVDANITIFSACGGSAIKCSDNLPKHGPADPGYDSRVDHRLLAGERVLVRVSSSHFPPNWRQYINKGHGELTISLAPVPSNDVCANAIPAAVGTTRVSTLNTYDEQAHASCHGAYTHDTWYSHVPDASGVISISLSEFVPFNIERPGASLLAYSGTCAGELIRCGNLSAMPVTAGVPVLIQVTSEAPGGNYELNISSPGIRPLNDTCQTAMHVGTGSHAFDSTYAINGAGVPGYPSMPPTLWYSFTNTFSNKRVVRFQTCGNVANHVMFITHACDLSHGWDFGAYGGHGGCDNDADGETIRICLMPQESVLVAVHTLYGGQGQHISGTLNITSNNAASNDTCAGALTLQLGNNTINTNFGCGYNDASELACQNPLFDSDHGVWYKFTATETGYARLVPGRYLGLSVFLGGCGGPSIACTNTEYREDLNFPVTAGTDYYIAVTEIASSGVTTQTGTPRLTLSFTPGVFEPPYEIALPEPETCENASTDSAFQCPNEEGMAEITTDIAYFGTTRSFDTFYVQGDNDDSFYFDLAGPGTVRFIGQTLYPGYIEVDNNIDEDNYTCAQMPVLEVDLSNASINTFDTGEVFIPVAGRHSVALYPSGLDWRTCSDNDIAYWIQMVSCSSCGVPCKADYNRNGQVTVQDIFDYLNRWFVGDTPADFNEDGRIAVQDIFDFLAAWFSGC